MAEVVDDWSANGKKNIFGQTVKVVEMQSEAGAAGAVHGSLQAGALTTTYTASQGLLLMIPNLYKMAGELLPGVLHVSARALAASALNIFGDHQDVMACRQTGVAMLASSNVQEVMDIGSITHLVSIETRVPFIHFFDGFRTSHEIQKIEALDYDDLAKLVNYEAIKEFRGRSLNPERPVVRGTAQNPDIYFQGREASNKFYDSIPDVVQDYMNKMAGITGRQYHPFDYYGAPDAENVIVAMGSICDTIDETIDYLMAKGEKVGCLKVHLYRPFSAKYFFNVMPKTVKKISVLDRTKEPGSPREPLFLDVINLYYNEAVKPVIIGGRFGLGSKDTTPAHILSVFNNLKKDVPMDHFTVGINDDVNNTSLPVEAAIETSPEGTISCKFWGLGSDGTVGANKQAIKIIGDKTDLFAQGYFSYDSKKSGGATVSHLRFGKKAIKSPYLVSNADYIACHNGSYVYQYDLLKGLKKNGTFLLNTPWKGEEIEKNLPVSLKNYIAKNNINFYVIDAVAIATEIGLGGRINMIMQSAFFKLSNVIQIDKAVEYLKDSIVKSYGKKGQNIVDMNWLAVDRGLTDFVKVEVPASWATATETNTTDNNEPAFIKNILRPMNALEGDNLPVSAFNGVEDGSFPLGTAAYEKRGIAVIVPEWKCENCIQCNQCAYVCPHAVIRPILMNEAEKKNAPASFESKKAIGKGLEGLEYRIAISPFDCTGCGNCAQVCPAPKKALEMKSAAEQQALHTENWKFAMTVTDKDNLMEKSTLKGSQFARPLMEFSGACAGCGETPYVKLITQLFGDRMMIANATGCSSIWGASAPSVPYTTNACGQGPAWANSLFEDNAEFGLGMHVAVEQIREKLTDLMNESMNTVSPELAAAFAEWIAARDNAQGSKIASNKIVEIIKNGKDASIPAVAEILEKKDFLIKKSQWIFGGDGWAYDIGFGGLDHVIASGDNVNILVMDTEVYSNTGGQSSKATPTAAVAKFAASGKKIRKKDLGMIAMSYGYVYVAQIAMGANMNQALKAIAEAEAYNGPSVIIAYAPCVNHGIKTGMGTTIAEEKKAVETGYWHLYRFNPTLKAEGKNPFVLESKEPNGKFMDFINGEIRYTSLKNTFPGIAEEMFKAAEEDSKERYLSYKRMAEMQF